MPSSPLLNSEQHCAENRHAAELDGTAFAQEEDPSIVRRNADDFSDGRTDERPFDGTVLADEGREVPVPAVARIAELNLKTEVSERLAGSQPPLFPAGTANVPAPGRKHGARIVFAAAPPPRQAVSSRSATRLLLPAKLKSRPAPQAPARQLQNVGQTAASSMPPYRRTTTVPIFVSTSSLHPI